MVKCPEGCKLIVTGPEIDWTPITANGFGALSKAVGVYIGDLGLTVEETEDCVYLHPKFRANPHITNITKDFCFSILISNTRAEMTVVQVLNKDNFTKDLVSDKLDIVKFDKLTCGATDGIEIKVVTMLPPFAGGLNSERVWQLGCSPKT